MQLTSKKIYPSVPAAPIPVDFVKPLSYEFRVVEYIKSEKVTKVCLQVQVWEHDEFGVGIVKQPFTDVDRIKLPDLS